MHLQVASLYFAILTKLVVTQWASAGLGIQTLSEGSFVLSEGSFGCKPLPKAAPTNSNSRPDGAPYTILYKGMFVG
jgi:hypothetical protein